MNSLLKFNKLYFYLAVFLFAIEIIIAKFAHDRFIRPYVGDVLVVILIYCIIKSFLNTPILGTALSVLAFSFVVEGLQYLKILNILGLQHSKFATLIIGTTFAWNDIIAYIIGIIIVVLFEKKLRFKN
ncbi:MAG: DUF2809 domain-containing protein [Pseudarcicella sp.]|nr:DUF2809 domain-containing protein [Pseudarcicella sp.]MBP6410053.1 DUF2809 domain-containing protein [Pseudarcicella sp.]